MSLVEILVIEVGSSIAKSLSKLCLKNSDVAASASSSVIDVLTSWTKDRVTQQKAHRQLEAIGERVAESLLPLFEAEGAGIDEEGRIAVAKAVAETLSTITSQVIVQIDLEPSKLAKHLLEKYPAKTYFFNEAEMVLYQRILSESCEYIIRIASQLPNFTEQTFGEVLKREGQLLALAEQTLQEVLRIRERLNPKTEAARFELDYRRAVIYKLDEVQLFGTDIATARHPYRLSVAYVTLSVEQKRLNAYKRSSKASLNTTMATTMLSNEVTRNIISVDEALLNSRYLLIRGLAGSGKTTLLQWIAVNSASQSFTGTLTDWNATLPFYIQLRRYVQEELPAPETFLKHVTPAIADKMPKGWVHAELESGRAIVLIDGLDEVPDIKREAVRTWLRDLIKNYPKVRFIVTSRPHAIEEGWLAIEGFKDAELQPMELFNILTFIDYWHAAIAEGLQNEEEKAELPFSSARLKQEIEEDHSKRNLATNPLLCVLLCSLNLERRQQLPSDRIELYEACCQMLVERRDKERNISLSDYPAAALTYSQKSVLLEDLAYWLVKNGWSEIPLEDADERFGRKLINMQTAAKNISGVDIRQLFIERSGILRSPAADRIDFVHRTFQEFFAAKAAIDEGDSGLLVQNAHNDQWREVIILAAGLATKRVREALILKLIARADDDRDHYHQIYLLAVACLETGVEQLGQHVRTEVQKRLGPLVPPSNMASARALAAAGELAIPYLKKQYYRKRIASQNEIACIHALILIGSQEALKALEDYAENAESAAINEFFRGWNVFDKEIYARSVIARVFRNMSLAQLNRFIALEGFQYLDDLTLLNLSKCKLAIEIVSLLNTNALTYLNLSQCSQIDNLSCLARLTKLTSLDISGCNRISDLGPLTGFSQLIDLNVSGCNRISDLSPLTGLSQLVSLNVSGCNRISDLSPLTGLSQLVSLNVAGCAHLGDLSPLATLKQLTALSLRDCSQLTDLSPLAKLNELKELDLAGCQQISDISYLKTMTRLTQLDLSDCLYITDFTPLLELDKLKRLYLRGFSLTQVPQVIRDHVETFV